MISQKTLKLYVYVDGVNDVPFYGSDSGEYEEFIVVNGEQFVTSNGFVFNVRNVNEQIEIGAFRYDAKRMGGAPTVTFTLMYEDCLDNFWSDGVYAIFNGERYFLKQTPTSSFSNEDTRYKHNVELVSERVILDNVYFFDAVVGNPKGEDKPVSNSTKVVFFGDVREFARRMNASLEYAKLLKWEDGVDEEGNAIKIPNGYHVVVDEGIITEEKLMSFEDQFFSNVLQEIYNTYEVPYYFDGKTIHVGNAMSLGEGEEIPTFAYGVDDALLSITKNNANQKVVNRATATGSSDNIQFYYPNDSPKGEIELFASGSLTTEDIKILDRDDFTQLHVDKTYSFFGDSSANSESLKAVVPSQSVEVEFVDDNATLNKVYIEDGKSVDVQIRYDANFESDADSKIELSWQLANYPNPSISMAYTPTAWGKDHLELEVKRVVMTQGDETYEIPFESITEKHTYYSDIYSRPNQADTGNQTQKLVQTGIKFETPNLRGVASIVIEAKFKTLGNFWSCVPDYYWGEDSKKKPYSDIVFESSIFTVTTGGWKDEDGKSVNMKNFGIQFLKDPQYGDTLGYHIVKYINTSQNLMPSVYRATDGAERFYNAINYPYSKPEGFDDTLLNGYYGEDGILRNPLGEYEIEGLIHNDAYKNEDGSYIHFNNPYVEGRPKEHIFTVEDIKPSIKETVNSMGLRMDMFSEFAYDLDDNDELVENEEGNEHDYVHSYFFGKLRKLDFNLFEHAIENQPMTISFTSGDCGACNFEIGATEEFPQKNPVQVNEDGTLKRDEKGRVICGQFEKIREDECQPQQQDTINNEVWIALKKEDTTYGILMPKATIYEDDGVTIKEAGHRPKACTKNEDGTYNNDGDTFVILGINLPKPYTLNAEKKVEAEIIKYIKDNNEEKFTFSITFSRIYFEENSAILDYLNENSKIAIVYNGQTYELYVSSFSYNIGEGDVLPEIRVELDDTLKVSQNALQNAIGQVKSELGSALSGIDFLGAVSPHFIRKDVDDEVQGNINFAKGIKFGEGGKVEVLDNNSAKLTIEYLEVTKKASFTSLEIKEKTHVGGQIIISPAAMTCGEVEEFDGYYRCYFQTKGAEGDDEIFNQFAEGDLAICQTYNAWGSRYYWRLVVGVGEDYIDLSKIEGEYDEDSDIPMAGDKIVQLGNTADKTRQAAQVLSAYGADSPSFIMYNGIDSFSLEGKNITGIIWNPETQEPQMYSYGSFFFGDRQLAGNYITFQKPEDKDEKELYISANVTLGSDSTGLSNLEEFKSLDATVKGVQDQIDGVVENWSEEGMPLVSNYPASEWVTDAEKIAHINDTYINIEAYVDDETTPTSGQAWRWCKCANDSTITDYVTVTDSEGNTFNLHWHPIADSDAVKALKKVKDFEYLADTLGKSVDVEGAVLAQTLAVKDDDGDVNAMLNGSDIGKDEVCGRLVMAGGIPATSSSGSNTLNDRAKEATTRIYEDGCVYTKNMHLEEGCTIGGFSITEYAIGIDGCNTLGASHGVIMTRHGFNARGTTNTGSQCKIERDVTISANSDDSLIDAETRLDTHNAFYIRQGLFAGLRPKTRVITTAKTARDPNVLDEFDFSVFVNLTSGTCYIDLPQTPLDGQEYYIESRGANMAIHMYQAGYSLYSGNTSAVGYTVAQTGRALLRFKYYKDAGIWVYSWLNRAS